MFQFDAIERAIRRRFAPDFATALQSADQMDLMVPRDSVRVPLQADVRILHDKNLAAFVVRARLISGDTQLGGECLFSTIEIKRTCDKIAIIEHLFEEAKRQMLIKLADGELDKILAGQPSKDPSPS